MRSETRWKIRDINKVRNAQKLTGDASEKVVKGIESFSPEFGKMMIEFGFGDIYSRPHFNLKQQEIITLTSLISQGASERQLVFILRLPFMFD